LNAQTESIFNSLPGALFFLVQQIEQFAGFVMKHRKRIGTVTDEVRLCSFFTHSKKLTLLTLSTMEIIYCFAELAPMLARNRGYYQRGILRHTIQLNRPIAIHTFGGRGSPSVSSIAV
jgi:hypothetical protein